MEDRIAVLERDVDAIKSELAVIRYDRTNAAELTARVSRIELDLVTIKGDISQLQKDVSQLQRDVAQLREELVLIRIELTKLNTQQSQYVTTADLIAVQADVKEVVANLKGWMLGIALTVMTLNFGMNVIFYNAQKIAPVAKPAQAQQIIPLAKQAPAILR
jgi:predicted  nucleic acid-binding Zn-ribbon protein